MSAVGREREGLGNGDCAEVFNKLDFAKEDVGSVLRAVAGDCDTIVELLGTNGGALCDNGVLSLNEQTLHSKSIHNIESFQTFRHYIMHNYMLPYGGRLFHTLSS